MQLDFRVVQEILELQDLKVLKENKETLVLQELLDPPDRKVHLYYKIQ